MNITSGLLTIKSNLSINKDNLNALNWYPGKIVHGTVYSKLSDKTYIFSINDKKIVAESSVLLSDGQQITMEIQGRKEHQYIVKLINQENSNLDTLKIIINQLGIKDTNLNRSLIKAFLTKGLPLKYDLIQKASQLIQTSGQYTQEEILMVIQGLKWNIYKVQTLKAVQSFLYNEKQIGNEGLINLAKYLKGIAVSLNGKLDEHSTTKTLLQKINQMVNQTFLKPEEGSLSLKNQLQNLFASQLPISKKDLKRLSRQSLSFSKLLQNFSRFLQEAEANLNKVQGFKESYLPLIEEGKRIEKQLEGQQIFQSLWDLDQENYLYFNLPIIQKDKILNWGQIKIKKDINGKKIIDPQNLNFSILVNTKNLGPLQLDIKIWKKEVSASGKVTKEWVKEILVDSWQNIQKTFSSMGYKLNNCKWEVCSFEEKLQPHNIFSLSQPNFKLSFLDRKV